MTTLSSNDPCHASAKVWSYILVEVLYIPLMRDHNCYVTD